MELSATMMKYILIIITSIFSIIVLVCGLYIYMARTTWTKDAVAWDGDIVKRRSYKPSQVELAAYNESKSAVLNLFDSLPKIPSTTMEPIESVESRFRGKHRGSINGWFQGYNANYDNVPLWSSIPAIEVCNIYKAYFVNKLNEWEELISNTPSCTENVLLAAQGIKHYSINYKKSGMDIATTNSQFKIEILAEEIEGLFYSAPIGENGKRESIRTKITININYYANFKAWGDCVPDETSVRVNEEWPCNSSSWWANGVR
jgi:hypothetical protein